MYRWHGLANDIIIGIIFRESMSMDTRNDFQYTRIETDSMGDIDIPISAYYGSQTERSKRNFDVASDTDKMPVMSICLISL